MNNKFIYVFNAKDRDILLQNGLQLLKSDESQDVYIFKYKQNDILSQHDIAFVLSNVLSF